VSTKSGVAHLRFNPYVSGKLFPLHADNYYYIVSNSHRVITEPPVPPKDLWVGYEDTEEEYLSGGQRHVFAMQDILRKAGAPSESLYRVLELGCAGARMVRFYPYVLEYSELWGVDISAKHITSCQIPRCPSPITNRGSRNPRVRRSRSTALQLSVDSRSPT